MKLKALIIYPNKEILIKRLNVEEMRFTIRDRAYIIDEKAIYFHKRKPLLIYHFDNASPLLFSNLSIDPSLRPSDINAIIESKMIKDLLSSSLGSSWVMILAGAAAVLSLINTLILAGVIKPPGG